MKNLVMIAVVALLMASCAPSIQKQRYRAVTFYQQNPKELAELCAKEYPIKEVLIPGDTVYTPGPVVELPGDTVDCPDGSQVVTPPKKAQCPPNTHTTDTLIQENTALVEALRFHQQELSQELYKEEVLREIAEKKVKKLTWWLIGAGAVFIGSIILKLKRFI